MKDVQPSLRIPATLVSASAAGTLRQQAASIAALAKIDPEQLTILEHIAEKPEGSVAMVVGPVELYLPLEALVDPAEQRARLQKDLAEAQSQITRLENLLNSPFAEKAPPPVVAKEREKLAAFRETAEKLERQLGLD